MPTKPACRQRGVQDLATYRPVIVRETRATFLRLRRRGPPRSTLFPYTTLFRSGTAYSMGRLGGDEVLRYDLGGLRDRKSTRLNSSHVSISYAVFCLKNKIHVHRQRRQKHDIRSCVDELRVDASRQIARGSDAAE